MDGAEALQELRRAGRPGEIEGIAPAGLARDVERGQRCLAEVLIEAAGAAEDSTAACGRADFSFVATAPDPDWLGCDSRKAYVVSSAGSRLAK